MATSEEDTDLTPELEALLASSEARQEGMQRNPSPVVPLPRRPPPGIPTPAERRKLARGAAEVTRLRRKLGWDKLADLPDP